MIITSISLDGIDLTSGNYQFHLSGFQDSEKDIVANDLFSDGQAWGRSKTKAKTLVLEGYILSGGEAAEWDLNRVLAPNKLKTLIINQKYQCQVEVTNRGSTADNSHAITVQLTMPDPYLYAMDSVSAQLGAQYSTGVVFGTNRGVTFGPRKNLLNPATGSLPAVGSAAATQMLDGDFTTPANWTGSAAGISLSGVKTTITANGTVNGEHLYGTNTFLSPFVAGHRYFIYTDVQVVMGQYSLEFFYKNSAGTYVEKDSSIKAAGYNGPVGFNVDIPSDATLACIYRHSIRDATGSQVYVAHGESSIVSQCEVIDMGTGTSNPFYSMTAAQMLQMVTKKGYWEGSAQLGGVDCTIESDGTFVADGVVVANTNLIISPLLTTSVSPNTIPIISMISGKPYTFSRTDISGVGAGAVMFTFFDNSNTVSASTKILETSAASATFTAGSTSPSTSLNVGLIRIWFNPGSTFASCVIRLQFEQGSVATTWTPHSDEGPGVVFDAATGESSTITNEGNADAYPVIHVVGTCSGPSVANLTTGETIAVNVTLGDSDELVIDCRPDTCGVYLNGVANIGIKQGAGWIHCPPGDSIFSFARNSLEDKKHCTIELQSRWI